MLIFLLFMKIVNFITWKQFLVIGLFEILSIYWRKVNENKTI